MRTIIEPFKIKSNVWERRATVPGYRFVEQAPALRHFTARFAPLT